MGIGEIKANSTEEVLHIIVHNKIHLQSEAQVLQNNINLWKKKINETKKKLPKIKFMILS